MITLPFITPNYLQLAITLDFSTKITKAITSNTGMRTAQIRFKIRVNLFPQIIKRSRALNGMTTYKASHLVYLRILKNLKKCGIRSIKRKKMITHSSSFKPNHQMNGQNTMISIFQREMSNFNRKEKEANH